MPKGVTAKTKLKNELKNELAGIIFIAVALFMLFCLWQGTGRNDLNTLGAVGSVIYRLISTLFGSGNILLPILLLIIGISKLWRRLSFDKFSVLSWTGLFISALAMLHLSLPFEQQTAAEGWAGLGGGVTGAVIIKITLTLFGRVGSYIFLAACASVALIGIFKKTLGSIIREIFSSVGSFFEKTRQELADYLFERDESQEAAHFEKKKSEYTPASPEKSGSLPLIVDHVENRPSSTSSSYAADSSPAVIKPNLRLVKDDKDKDAVLKINPDLKKTRPSQPADFVLPSQDLLQLPPKTKGQRLNKDITDNVRILEETLDNFGVKARVTQVSRGPSITRYEIQPPPGIKVSRIVNLADDIALSLAAPQVRIEAPIPGKAAVGIEVPNEEISMVIMREVLETKLFQNSDSKLTVALGKDIAGNPIVADLSKMPHLLIAGATGSGKSVCMNAIIASILFKANPDEVKMVMIDPKVVELSTFNGIPHLISPVVTDPKKAATALRWAVHEMENRYELFAGLGVKDITRYNQTSKPDESEGSFPYLPYIVVLIDELADLMMVAPADVEDAICRLAQMARAAGIHLVVATQRPSVDVITGIIKANIPSRIAFAVSSQTDSRTILDMGGAERLLGRGDMLFYPTGMAKPLRVQGVYVSDQEIDNLVAYLKTQKEAQYETPWLNTEQEASEIIEEDELLSEAARIFIESGQASISLLQRRMRIGYTRAARIIDQLEERGIVGGYEGSKPRAIRMTWEDYEKTFGSQC